jgi:hypothetical protein
MRILVKYPNSNLEIKEIDGSLKSMQKIVGGYIEVVKVPHSKILLVCNEEGLLLNLPVNRVFGHNFVGTVFFCREDGEEFISLTDEDINYLMSLEQ